MSQRDTTTSTQFAFRGRWHKVLADGVVGPQVGRIVIFRCARWAPERDIQGRVWGPPPVRDEQCERCTQPER